MAAKKETLQEKAIKAAFPVPMAEESEGMGETEALMRLAIHAVFDPRNPHNKTRFNQRQALTFAVAQTIFTEFDIPEGNLLLERLSNNFYSLNGKSREEMVRMIQASQLGGIDEGPSTMERIATAGLGLKPRKYNGL